MTLSILRNLRTFFASALLAGLVLMANAVDSAAQAAPGQGPAALRAKLQAFTGHAPLAGKAPHSPTSDPTWTFLLPSFGDLDPLLWAHTAAYDANSNIMVVFGGFNENQLPQNELLLETNANGSAGLETGVWSQMNLSPAPPPRALHSGVYDQASNRMIVFGGCADGPCHTFLNDTWVLTNASGVAGTPAWIQLFPTGNLPAPRESQNAVYDAAHNRMIIYSGDINTGSEFSDVWVLSNANGLGGTPAWTELFPAGGTPDAIDTSTAVYDPTTNTMIVFGGGSFTNSVWTLSNANGLAGTPLWTNIIPNQQAGSPSGRRGAGAVYDPASNRMTIYGGNDEFGYINPDFDFRTVSDVWVLANANGFGGKPSWTHLHPKFNGDGNITPGGRTFCSTVRDPVTDSMIIFAGVSIEANYGSPWVLSHASGK